MLERLTPKVQHEVVRERLSLSDAILRMAERLRGQEQVTFISLFAGRQHAAGDGDYLPGDAGDGEAGA